MKGKFFFICCFISFKIFAQTDTTIAVADTSAVEIETEGKNKLSDDGSPLKLFHGQRLINTNTVEVLHKGVMEFRVIHNFNDIAGDGGGIRRFFGLDEAVDIKIGFQIGLGNKLNILGARTKGSSSVAQMWELGLKYQFLRQELNDPKHPFSMTLFTNIVAAAVRATKTPTSESNFNSFGDRLSELVQLMIARKFGSVTLQLNPAYVHRHYVIPGDDNSLLAIGGGARIPITKKFILLADYFHTFRSQESKDVFAALPTPIHFTDPFAFGIEILTEGHVFHLNFTNAREILENRMLARTFSRWEKGEFRWTFSISRHFIVFRDKKAQ